MRKTFEESYKFLIFSRAKIFGEVCKNCFLRNQETILQKKFRKMYKIINILDLEGKTDGKVIKTAF